MSAVTLLAFKAELTFIATTGFLEKSVTAIEVVDKYVLLSSVPISGSALILFRSTSLNITSMTSESVRFSGMDVRGIFAAGSCESSSVSCDKFRELASTTSENKSCKMPVFRSKVNDVSCGLAASCTITFARLASESGTVTSSFPLVSSTVNGCNKI